MTSARVLLWLGLMVLPLWLLHAEESVVARLVMEKLLTPQLTAQTLHPDTLEPGQKPGIGFGLSLKNLTGKTLPGWELSQANAVRGALYRLEGKAETLVGRGQWNLIKVPPQQRDNANMVIRDAPNAAIQPSEEVLIGIGIALEEGQEGDPRMCCGVNGQYRLEFFLAADQQLLGTCTFTVDGSEGAKSVAIDLPAPAAVRP